MRISRLLIANRGEIARRIIRSCKRLGIQTVAICTPSEFYSPYTTEADFHYEFASEELSETYLSSHSIINVAKSFNVDAIHPGYGFLSENADFAELVQSSGFIFVGPSPKVIRQLGEKHQAIELAKRLNIPTIPGVRDVEGSKLSPVEISNLGFPLIIKAAFGGGGRGMRLVTAEAKLSEAIISSRRESLAAFGRDDIICERYISPSRHIEVQLLGDKHGNLIHLYERECSLQRRYQKVIEEAPAPGIDPELLNQILHVALLLGKEAKLDNAATVEFILALDENSQPTGEFYFMEVNPRLQVEHTVTEEITGLDIVELQLSIASNQPLGISQSAIKVRGHAIQARVCAESPAQDFIPTFGRVLDISLPFDPKIRVESSLAVGAEIAGRYDSMLLKLISHSDNRNNAAKCLSIALQDLNILGITCNCSFLANTLKGEFYSDSLSFPNSTTFSKLQLLYAKQSNPLTFAVIAFASVELYDFLDTAKQLPLELVGFRSDISPPDYQHTPLTFSPEHTARNFVLELEALSNHFPFQARLLSINGNLESGTMMIEIKSTETKLATHCLEWEFKNGINFSLETENFRVFSDRDKRRTLSINSFFGRLIESPILINSPTNPEQTLLVQSISSPLPGRVLEIKVSEGVQVKKGEPLLVLESMKTEHLIYSDREGIIKAILHKAGDLVKAKDPLIIFV